MSTEKEMKYNHAHWLAGRTHSLASEVKIDFRSAWWGGRGVVLRWWRNRMGKSLSPPQIHWKIIWTLSKFHKTTSECWQSTPGTRKAVHSLRKEVGQTIKDKKRDKRVRDGDPSQGGGHEGGKVSKHQETLSPVGLWGVLESQRET